MRDVLSCFAVAAIVGEQAAQGGGIEEFDRLARCRLAPDFSLSLGQIVGRLRASAKSAFDNDCFRRRRNPAALSHAATLTMRIPYSSTPSAISTPSRFRSLLLRNGR